MLFGQLPGGWPAGGVDAPIAADMFLNRFGPYRLRPYSYADAVPQMLEVQRAMPPAAMPPVRATGYPMVRGGNGGRAPAAAGARSFSFGSAPVDLGIGEQVLAALGYAAPGPVGLATGAINLGVRANNLAYRDNVLRGLGWDGLSIGQVIGGLLGLNGYGRGTGMIGSGPIGGRNYGVSIGGAIVPGRGAFADGTTYEGRTTLTPEEARRRATLAKSYAANARTGGGFADPNRDHAGAGRGYGGNGKGPPGQI